MGSRKTLKLSAIIAFGILLVYFLGCFFLPKVRRHLEERWYIQFDEGNYTGAERTAKIVYWLDPKAYAIIHADIVIVDIMKGTVGIENGISHAIDGLDEHNYSDWPLSNQKDILETKAALNAMAGNITLAGNQAWSYCQQSWPAQKTLASCLNFHIDFISYALDRQRSVDLFAHVKLNAALGVTSAPVLKYYEALALMAFDIDKARRLRDELIHSDEFNEKMRDRYCAAAEYHVATQDDIAVCASTKSVPGIYSKW